MENIRIDGIDGELTQQDINDLISTALEGGINYWCGNAEIKYNADCTMFGVSAEDESKVEFISDVVGYGGVLILFDGESNAEWELDLNKMVNGITKHCNENGLSIVELMDNFDADDADCIVQYAVMNELVFG